MLKGSCACGQIRYEIQGDLLGPITYCHCWRCRKQSGSSFGTTAGLKATGLAFVAGEDLLRSWESSLGVRRFFASCCGSPIYKRDDADPEEIGFRLGTLDTDPSMQAEMHFSVSSKVPWIEIDDALPQSPGGSPFGLRD
ncbi:GFA family protein [Microvirga sp. BT689]|uniref:GFA family protein n=1 Tax=Microvirga arvi TaxID=2778731 RepID=UPI00194F8D03|nr:GFA family protein [Microvirga arvi]MBM6582994.1 GFA family protein [Microvirga arvi]